MLTHWRALLNQMGHLGIRPGRVFGFNDFRNAPAAWGHAWGHGVPAITPGPRPSDARHVPCSPLLRGWMVARNRTGSVLLLLLLCGCSLIWPTRPTDGPELRFTGATPEQQLLGWTLWAEVKSCVQYDGARSHGFRVDVVPGLFTCGKVPGVDGCFNRQRELIRVTGTKERYEPALAHEFIHYALFSKGRVWEDADPDHVGPAWAKCDWRHPRHATQTSTPSPLKTMTW